LTQLQRIQKRCSREEDCWITSAAGYVELKEQIFQFQPGRFQQMQDE